MSSIALGYWRGWVMGDGLAIIIGGGVETSRRSGGWRTDRNRETDLSGGP